MWWFRSPVTFIKVSGPFDYGRSSLNRSENSLAHAGLFLCQKPPVFVPVVGQERFSAVNHHIFIKKRQS